MSVPTDYITILHVDDESDFAESTARSLERIDERFAVEMARSVRAGLDRPDERAVDCIVSDYALPGRSGLEFLESVRETYPDLPFFLVTGEGSEEVASEAISAGVTDYLQKRDGADHFELLANRIRNAVEPWATERGADRRVKAMDSVNEGLTIVDPAGRFVEMNDTYAEIHGTEPEELLGEPWTTTVPEEEVPRLEAEVTDALEATGQWSGESLGEHADGSVFPTRLSLSAFDDGGYVCFVRDVSERREREAELRRNDAKLEVLFGQSPDMISVHDAEGKLLDVNDRICEELGYAEEELIGMHVWELDPGLEPEPAVEAWESMGTGEIMKIEPEFRRRDGSTFPAEVHVAKIELEGEPQFFVISRNITERKAYERRLRRQNERLDEFASLVSHDLRNPLTVAVGQLELAREDCESEHLDAIERSHARMQELIEDLRTLARQGDVVSDPEPVALAGVVETCWRNVDTADATLATETDAVVLADRSRLQQLLENLIANAVEHGGGAVTVTVGDLADGFHVEDDGIGIPEADLERVFDHGFTTDAEGTGFGLHIVEQIAEAHGWAPRVTDGTAGGARFEFCGVDV